MDIDGANAAVTLTLSLIALAGAVAGWVKWWKPKHEARERDRIAQRDALIGRPPITDSITGKEISPALPGIGHRMASTEGKLAEQSAQMAVIAEAVADLVKSNQRHEAHEHHLAVHDREIAELQRAQVERIVTKAESIEAYKTMQAMRGDTIDVDDDDLPQP